MNVSSSMVDDLLSTVSSLIVTMNSSNVNPNNSEMYSSVKPNVV